ncbi:helix-turn-helix domain-containing protein, partial [Microbacterium sp.]|uniref:helix-turn-helix domain-containing protein n=1 Tax=Microbacterium sp. TaxID=51671 RepID=UPI0039E71BC4
MPGLHDRTPHLKELGEFLKTRRDSLTPENVGLPTAIGQRRVAGLRREEVAQLINISGDYYTRIEQGRLAPSAPVLDALVDALQLDADQSDYARSLVAHAAAPASLAPARARQ